MKKLEGKEGQKLLFSLRIFRGTKVFGSRIRLMWKSRHGNRSLDVNSVNIEQSQLHTTCSFTLPKGGDERVRGFVACFPL